MSKLYRSRIDKKVTGLCGGLAQSLNIDSTLLRVLLIIVTFFSGGVVIPIYILASLVIPKEPYYGYPGGYPGPGDFHHPGEGGFHGWGHWEGKRHGRGHRGWQPGQGPQSHAGYEAGKTEGSPIDDMMQDIEKKALWKEIETLRAKVAQFEKNQSENNNN